ncbi:ribonuclease H-like domain-containing protein [Tanacetum coccineum]
MSASQDEITTTTTTPSKPHHHHNTPTQQTPHTVSTIKLPILKKGEYDIWAMKMEHYLAHTDYPIWEVIQNGNGPVSITTDTSGQIKVLPPRTAEEIVARERERKARTTLLMALPEDHLAKFHKMTDAKEMWDAIKSRFGGNDESKKMQKYILKQQFEGFSISNTEGLHKGYDRFQSLLSQLEIHGAGHFARECKIKGNQDNRRRDAWNSGTKDGSRTGKKEDSKALVIINGEGVDWSNQSEDQDYALMACNRSDSDTESVFMNKESDLENQPLYDSTEPSELVKAESVVNDSNVECQPKVWSDAPIIEEEIVKNQCTYSQKFKVDKKELGYRFTVRACFVCGSLNHLIRDCDFYEKRMARKAELNNDWNNVQRMNKPNQFVPSAVLTRTGKIPVSTARASSTKNFSTARQSVNRQTVNEARGATDTLGIVFWESCIKDLESLHFGKIVLI